jgi:hypothetical protein
MVVQQTGGMRVIKALLVLQPSTCFQGLQSPTNRLCPSPFFLRHQLSKDVSESPVVSARAPRPCGAAPAPRRRSAFCRARPGTRLPLTPRQGEPSRPADPLLLCPRLQGCGRWLQGRARVSSARTIGSRDSHRAGRSASLGVSAGGARLLACSRRAVGRRRPREAALAPAAGGVRSGVRAPRRGATEHSALCRPGRARAKTRSADTTAGLRSLGARPRAMGARPRKARLVPGSRGRPGAELRGEVCVPAASGTGTGAARCGWLRCRRVIC